MLKRALAFICFYTTSAHSAIPILPTDLPASGEAIFIGSTTSRNFDFEGDYFNSIFLERATIDSNSSSKSFDLGIDYGLSNKDSILAQFDYLIDGSDASHFNYLVPSGKVSYEKQYSGLGDLRVRYKRILADHDEGKFTFDVSTTLPVGNDDAGQSQILVNGIEVQSKKKGGASNGRVDYAAGLAYSPNTNSGFTPYADMGYTIRGKKTVEGIKIVSGNSIGVSFGFVFPLNAAHLDASLFYIGHSDGYSGDMQIASSNTTGLSISFSSFMERNTLVRVGGALISSKGGTITDKTDGSEIKYHTQNGTAFMLEIIQSY